MAMKKGLLHLSIDNDLVNLAKSSGLNLSAEFEEWLKIRMNQFDKEGPKENPELLIAEYRSKIIKLESQKQIEVNEEMKNKEKVMVIDNIIDNEEKHKKPDDRWEDIMENRIHGLQFLFQKRFNEKLEVIQAREMLIARLKERKNA